MSKLFDDDYPPTVAQAYRVARIRLTPHTPLASVGATLAEHEAALEAAVKAARDAEDAVLAQAASIRYADGQLGRTVVEIAREKRGTITGANPDQHPSFRALFPTAPSAAMAGPPDDAQDQYVAVVEAGLELPENAALKASRGAELADRKAKLENAEQTETTLAQKQALADAKLAQVVVAARLAFNEAQLDAASILKDEALVASLFDFRKQTRKKPKKVTE